MSKAQIQVPLILVVMVGLFIVYLLFVSPGERAQILGINTTVPGTVNQTAPQTPSNLVFSKNLGYIGRKTGNDIGDFSFGNLYLQYPLANQSVLEKGTTVLTSNILLKGSTSVTISGNYSGVTISGRVGSVEGTPNIVIQTGNVILYKGPAVKNQNINLYVDAAKIVANSVQVSCEWSGLLFWQSQKCELLDFGITKQAYMDVNPNEIHDFTATGTQAAGDDFKLCFNIDGSVNSAPMNVSINDVEVYNAQPVARSAAYCVRNSISNVGISQGTNTIEFSAAPGSVYNLSSTTLSIYEKSQEASNQTFYFNVPNNVYSQASSFLLSFNVNSILDTGGLDIVIGNIYYYLGPDQIVPGQNFVQVKKSDISSGTNIMRVESSTGRFLIGELNMTWE